MIFKCRSERNYAVNRQIHDLFLVSFRPQVIVPDLTVQKKYDTKKEGTIGIIVRWNTRHSTIPISIHQRISAPLA